MERACECIQEGGKQLDGVIVRLSEELERAHHTAKSQRGMLVQQGKEITRLRRQIKGREAQALSMERTNARLAKDLIDAWEFIWRIAGGLYVGANARQHARNQILKAKSTDTDRAKSLPLGSGR